MTVEIHPQVVFAGHRRAGLYRSTDGGLSWQSSSAGFNPEASIDDVIFDPTGPQTLYAADNFSGVYISQDGGQTWRAIHSGLTNRAVNALVLSSDGQTLYAALEGGGGVFRLDRSGQPPQAYSGAAGSPTTASPTQAAMPAQVVACPSPTLQPNATEPAGATGFKLPAICGGTAPLGLAALFFFSGSAEKKPQSFNFAWQEAHFLNATTPSPLISATPCIPTAG